MSDSTLDERRIRLGEIVRNARLSRDLTVAAVCRDAGLGRNALPYRKLEGGQSTRDTTVAKVERLFEFEPGSFGHFLRTGIEPSRVRTVATQREDDHALLQVASDYGLNPETLRALLVTLREDRDQQ